MEFNLRRGRVLAGGKAVVGCGGGPQGRGTECRVGGRPAAAPQSRPKDGLPCGPRLPFCSAAIISGFLRLRNPIAGRQLRQYHRQQHQAAAQKLPAGQPVMQDDRPGHHRKYRLQA